MSTTRAGSLLKKQIKIRIFSDWNDFESTWDRLHMQLKLNPERTAKNLLHDLIQEQPERFNLSLLKTLQRRVANWRMQQIKIQEENLQQNLFTEHASAKDYVSLVAHAYHRRVRIFLRQRLHMGLIFDEAMRP